MLTPAFELSQDCDFLTIVIKARFARISETEVFIDGTSFKFYSKPYFLRLTLPGALVEDGRERAEYDADKGHFTIRIPKEIPGEMFDGLDMLTKLMAPSGQVTASEPTIQPIASSKATLSQPGEVGDEEKVGEEDEGEINWEVEQTPCLQDEDDIIGPVTYGFAGRRSGVFSRLQEELSSIVDIPDPDQTQSDLRRKARWMAEQDKFNDEHYLADLHQDETIQQLILFKAPWDKLASGIDAVPPSSDLITFTDEEKEKMRKLPHKEYLVDKVMEKDVYMGLADILFGYAYNVRSSEGQANVESAWTICKLSSTLSWLDTFSSLEDVVVCCVRRALCYPLHRHWGLAMAVLKDVRTILHLGRNQVLKALLEVHSLLAQDDPRYILNELYITDYCVWIQGESHSKIQKLAEALDKVKISKKDVGLDLDELEEAARCVLRDEDEGSGEEGAIEMVGYPQLMQESKSLSQNGIGKKQHTSQSSDEEDSDGSEEDSDESEEEESEEEDRDASDENSDQDQESLAPCRFSSNSGTEKELLERKLAKESTAATDVKELEFSTEQRTCHKDEETYDASLVCNGQNSRQISELQNSDFKGTLSSCCDYAEDDDLKAFVSKAVSEEHKTFILQRNSNTSGMSVVRDTSHSSVREPKSESGGEIFGRKDNDMRSQRVPGTTTISLEEQPVILESNEQALQQDQDSSEVNHLSSRVASLMIEKSRSQGQQEQKLDSDDESDSMEEADEMKGTCVVK